MSDKIKFEQFKTLKSTQKIFQGIPDDCKENILHVLGEDIPNESIKSMDEVPELESNKYKNGLPVSCEKCGGKMTGMGNTFYESNPFTGITYYPSCTECKRTVTVTRDKNTGEPIISIYDEDEFGQTH